MDPRIADLKRTALKYRSKRKHSRAAEAFAELTELDPSNPQWPHRLGEALRNQGKEEQAVSAFEKAADAYLDKGFVLKAIALCNMVISLAPDNARAKDTLTRLHAIPAAQRRPSTRDHEGDVSLAKKTQGGIPVAGVPAPGEQPYDSQTFAPIAREIEFDDQGRPREAVPGLTTSPGAQQPDEEPEFKIPPPPPRGSGPRVQDHQGYDLLIPPPPPRQPEVAIPVERPCRGDTLDSIPLLDMVQDLVELEPDAQGAPIYQIPLEEPPTPEEELADRLPPIPLLSSLSRDELISFASKVEVGEYQPEQAIIRQGDQGDTMFILVEGSVAVVREGTPRVTLSLLSEGAFFGEYALLTDLKRTATVQALEDCTVLTITRAVMRMLVLEHPPVFKVLLRFFRDRMLGNLTHTHDLFRPFTREQRHDLIRKFSFLEVPPGRVLVQQGQKPDGLYLVVCGRARVHRSGKLPSPLQTGEMFNKTALMNRGYSSHTVKTQSKCWLLRLSRGNFRELIMTHPHVLATLAEAGITAAHQIKDLKPIEDREQTLPSV